VVPVPRNHSNLSRRAQRYGACSVTWPSTPSPEHTRSPPCRPRQPSPSPAAPNAAATRRPSRRPSGFAGTSTRTYSAAGCTSVTARHGAVHLASNVIVKRCEPVNITRLRCSRLFAAASCCRRSSFSATSSDARERNCPTTNPTRAPAPRQNIKSRRPLEQDRRRSRKWMEKVASTPLLRVDRALHRCYVIGERSQRVLDRDDMQSFRLEQRNDPVSARSVGESPVDQHDRHHYLFDDQPLSRT
jgi:hypothetical protein